MLALGHLPSPRATIRYFSQPDTAYYILYISTCYIYHKIIKCLNRAMAYIIMLYLYGNIVLRQRPP